MLKIEMDDLFWGFIRNYVTFGLRLGAKWTTRTNEILGFYAILGKMLGYYIEYEMKDFDLQWFWNLEDMNGQDPWLHIEHENDRRRLDHLIEKIEQSHSDNIIAIGYPPNENKWDWFLKELQKVSETLDKKAEVLAILNARRFEEKETPIKGYIFRNGKIRQELKAIRRVQDDGTYYAEPE